MLLAGTALAIPASLARRLRALDHRPLLRPPARRPRRRDGLPDHAGADHRALERAGADQVDRPLVGAGGGISALGPLVSGALLEQFDWDSVFFVTLPLAARRPLPRLALRPRPRQRDLRPGRQPRRHPLGGDGRRPGPGDQLRAGAGSGRRGRRARRSSPSPRSSPSSCASAARPRRSTTSRSPAGASSGSPPAPGSSSSAR